MSLIDTSATAMLDSFSATASPALCCQTFFVTAATVTLAVQTLPRYLRVALTDYGARRTDGPRTGSRSDTFARGRAHDSTQLTQDKGLAALLASLVRRQGRVPHSWFWHYYLVSLCWSAFWAWQYLYQGSAMATLAQAQAEVEAGAAVESTPLGRVFLAWLMLALQSGRRLYECFRVLKPGQTPMLPIHWILGLAFYSVMNMAVWVHGSGSIIASWASPESLTVLTPRTCLTLAVFFMAWFQQYECHWQLASLKKYTLPNERLFRYLVCPHYTCECVIYLAIAVMGAPVGGVFSTSLLCGLIFVAVNLGVTAHGTKQWYADKFGPERVASRWKMIPFAF